MTKLNTSDSSGDVIAERTTEIRQASMCRLCFKSKYLVSIGSDQWFVNQLANCLHQKISSDFENLPEFVCGECYQLVEALGQFKARCNRASKVMKRYIRKGGRFPEHGILEEGKLRRAEKRAASSRKGLDEPASKRRQTEETTVENVSCNEVCKGVIEPTLEVPVEVLDTQQENINEQYNPHQLSEKFEELFGACGDVDLPGLKQILAATPPFSPVEQTSEMVSDTNDDECQKEVNFAILTPSTDTVPQIVVHNPWIDAMDDEVLYSIMLNQLVESSKTVSPCRSYTSFLEDYVELQ